MSNYINEHTVLNAIKAVLDSDSTLDTLLNVKDGSSKVVLGMERPSVCALPVIHLAFLTRNIEPECKMNQITFRVVWFVSAYGNEIEDVQALANIGERIYDLLDDNLISVSGHQIQSFFAESGEGSAKDMLQPEGRPEHFQSLTFRMSIKRIA